MLSKSKMQKILKEIYGANLIDRQTLDRLFNSSEKEILGYLTSFIADDSNWSGKANKDDIEEIQAELNELSKDNNLVPLVSVMIANLRNATAGDVLQARISLPLIKVAQQQHRMIDNATVDVPKLLSKYSKLQAQEMPNNHKVPPNYDELLTKMIRSSWDEAHLSINKDINYTIQKIKQVAKQAASATDDNLNYAKRIDKILTGGKVGNGASGRAQSIIRTFASRALNETTFASYKARGIQYYRFLALESNTCTECQSMDGKIFKVDDATEGINRPPIHINCQCWTVPIENTNFVSGSEILEEDSKQLTKDEEAALKRYISSESYTLNDALRHGTLSKAQEKLVSDLDNALNKMPIYKGKAPLQRDYFFDRENLNRFISPLNIGGKYSDASYLSTSKIHYGEGMEQIHVIIESSISGRDISNFNSSEKEVLFPRNTKFRINDINFKDGIVQMTWSEIHE